MKIICLQTNNQKIGVSALSPEYQTAREKAELLQDPKLLERLGDGEVITEIRKTESGYTAVTNLDNEIEVEVKYLPSGIGPKKFEFVFNDAD